MLHVHNSATQVVGGIRPDDWLLLTVCGQYQSTLELSLGLSGWPWCSWLGMSLELSGPFSSYLVGAVDWTYRCSHLVVIWLVQLIGYTHTTLTLTLTLMAWVGVA